MIVTKGSDFIPVSLASADVVYKERFGSGMSTATPQRACMTRFSIDPAPSIKHISDRL